MGAAAGPFRVGILIGGVSPQEIDRLTIDRQARLVAGDGLGETPADHRGPMASFESAWAVRALSGLLGTSSAAAADSESSHYAYVPAVDPAATQGTTLRYSLSRVNQPWKSALGCLAVTLFWNGITWFFVWAHLTSRIAGAGPGGQVEWWKPWLLLTPFVVIGLVAIGIFGYMLWNAIADSRAGSNLLEVLCEPDPARRAMPHVSVAAHPLLAPFIAGPSGLRGTGDLHPESSQPESAVHDHHGNPSGPRDRGVSGRRAARRPRPAVRRRPSHLKSRPMRCGRVLRGLNAVSRSLITSSSS